MVLKPASAVMVVLKPASASISVRYGRVVTAADMLTAASPAGAPGAAAADSFLFSSPANKQESCARPPPTSPPPTEPLIAPAVSRPVIGRRPGPASVGANQSAGHSAGESILRRRGVAVRPASARPPTAERRAVSSGVGARRVSE